MPKFTVSITHSISVDVDVEADTAEGAIDKARRADFPLPPREDWSGLKDWQFQVFNDKGDLIAGDI